MLITCAVFHIAVVLLLAGLYLEIPFRSGGRRDVTCLCITTGMSIYGHRKYR
jgi:hypothetical protein